MSNRLKFKTRIELKCYIINAEVAIAEETHYILPVLAHIKGHGNDATVKSLSDELFLKKPLSRALFRIGIEYKLINEKTEDHYELTYEGVSSVEEKRVFLKNNNKMWKIHYLDHPLVEKDYRIVKIEEDTRNDAGYKNDGPQEMAEFSIEKNVTLTPIVGEERKRFRISEYSSEAKEIKSEIDAVLAWNLDEDSSRMVLETTEKTFEYSKNITMNPKAEKHPMHSPDTTYEEVWAKLLEDEFISGWDDERKSLEMRFGDTSTEERVSMAKTLHFEDPEPIPDMYDCKFDSVDAAVQIHPDHYSAQEWAEYLLVERIKEYITQNRFERLSREIKKKFSEYDITFGEKKDYLPDIYDKQRSLYWHIQAGEDWDI